MSRLLPSLVGLGIALALGGPLAEAAERSVRGDSERPDLAAILERLAERAALHKSMLYEFNCIEDLARLVARRADDRWKMHVVPERTLRDRFSLVIAKDDQGMPTELRFRLDDDGNVARNRKGKPVPARLDKKYSAIARAVPHAQASWFTESYQQQLRFRLLTAGTRSELGYRLECAEPWQVPVEFLDRDPPVRKGRGARAGCSARASGRMCVDPSTGEIGGIEFYQLYDEGGECRWHRTTPFVRIDQQVVEERTGLRFPSHVETYFFMPHGAVGIIAQEFRDCAFTRVRVRESFDPRP